nr:uncharacterized protein c24b11.05 [Quercus suber]
MDSCSKSLLDSVSPFNCLIFDLDDTLYSSKVGISESLRKNIDDFLVEKCGFPESKASTLRVELFKKYGSSLAGLRASGYDIDADDYHSFVHGRLPYDLIKPDSQLRNLLRSITQRKIIFTNSDRAHAVKVLDRLGLKDCFEQILCFETMNPNLPNSTRPDEIPVLLKPSMDAMKIALDVADVDPRRTASTLRVELFKKYGSSLAGLRASGYDIDADDYHSFVHGRLPYDLIKPDSQLRNLLRSITQRKIIFTNSDRAHAVKVLDRLGLKDCFEQILCFKTMNPNLPNSTRPDEFPVLLKPSMDAMKIALDVADVDPRRTLFLDDNVKNVAAGKALVLRTVLVGKTVKSKEADYALENVNNLAQVIPEIWVHGMDGGDQRMSRSKSEIESILAITAVVA